MSSLVIWVVWGVFAFVAVLLGFVARQFTVRTLRWVTAVTAGLLIALITRYGMTHPAKGSADLVNAFRQGANELAAAFFHPLLLVLPGNHLPPSAPGRIGWIVIAVLLVGGYRVLEAWAIHRQAPALDTTTLDSQPNGTSSKTDGSAEDGQLHDQLVARLKFQLSAIEVRAPAILPGGSRSNGLASIASASGVAGGTLAGAIIQFFGMLWPNPRRFQVRVRAECAADGQRVDGQQADGQQADGQQNAHTTRVTVSLDEPATGESIATKTLTADHPDEAPALVAGYVARQIFIRDPTIPPWCVGAASGRDLAAMLLVKQKRVHAKCPGDIENERRKQIVILEQATGNNQYAGVLRYELAQLYDLAGRHMEALRLHAVNREQHPRFYRGRYRLSMSLEMIANPAFPLLDPDKPDEHQTVLDKLDETLKILNRCGVTSNVKRCDGDIEGGLLQPGLRGELLTAAGKELRAIRQQLTLWHVIWGTFRYRDERLIRIPHWHLRKRQSFYDGVAVAELLVAIRQCLNEEGCSGISEKSRMRLGLRIVTGIARDKVSIEQRLAKRKAQGASESRDTPGCQDTPESQGMPESQDAPESQDRELPPAGKRDKTRWLRWQYRTPSWEAAYNTACAYAALKLDHQVVNSLRRAIDNRDCEMQRPSDWISNDPDFRCLKSSNEFKEFNCFLKDQTMEDYPPAMQCPVHADGAEPTVGAGVSRNSHEPEPAGSVAD